jgi:hypothetical protein
VCLKSTQKNSNRRFLKRAIGKFETHLREMCFKNKTKKVKMSEENLPGLVAAKKASLRRGSEDQSDGRMCIFGKKGCPPQKLTQLWAI